MPKSGARPFWVFGAREVRVHTLILGAGLWIVAAVALLWPGPVDPFGRLKFPDFVHFYTLGDMAGAGRFDHLYDASALHQQQVERVPESAGLSYLPVYSPQTSLIFVPLAGLPYLAAGWVWAGVTALVYAMVVSAVWRSTRTALPDGRFVAAAAAAFPPFWSLILHGQTTLVPLAAFALAWMALARGRSFAAGLALGLLTVKPQFGVLLVLVTLASREWVLILGAVTSVALQAGIVALVMGADVLGTYAHAVLRVPALAAQLEPRPYHLHSVRAWTQLLPTPLAAGAYGFAALAIAWYATRAWRSVAPLELRLGVVILAACLANPHFTVYDATVLAIPLLWIGASVEKAGDAGIQRVFWPLVYGLYAVLLLPTALIARLQLSVVLLGVIFWLAVRETRENPCLDPGEGQSGL